LWILKGREGILLHWTGLGVLLLVMGSVCLRKRRWKNVGGDDDDGDDGDGGWGVLVGGSEGRRMTDLRDLLLERKDLGSYMNPIFSPV
jgi:hypothetical protein